MNDAVAEQLITLLDFCYVEGNEEAKRKLISSPRLINQLRHTNQNIQILYTDFLMKLAHENPKTVFQWIRQSSFEWYAYNYFTQKNKLFFPQYLDLFHVLLNKSEHNLEFAVQLRDDFQHYPWVAAALVKSQPSEVIMKFLELLAKLKTNKPYDAVSGILSIPSFFSPQSYNQTVYSSGNSIWFDPLVNELIQRKQLNAVCFIINQNLISDSADIFKDLKRELLAYLEKLNDDNPLKDVLLEIKDKKTSWGRLFHAQRSWTLRAPDPSRGILGQGLQAAEAYEKKKKGEKNLKFFTTPTENVTAVEKKKDKIDGPSPVRRDG